MSRLILVWPIAATAPRNIDATARKTRICRHSATAKAKGSYRTRASSAAAATLGAEAKNAVTGLGAPS